MSNIILPDDPNFNQPIVMGDPFTVDHTRDLHKQGVTPGTIKQEREKQRNDSPGTFKYADSVVVNTPDPLFKQAQQSGVDNMMTQPMWFSPLHTPQNWQIASKRREVYQWLYLPCSQVLTEDYTFQDMSEFIENVYTDEIIEDTLTGGVIYENIECSSIMGVIGEFRQPIRASERHCKEKICYSFSATGFWRKVSISEEHKIAILDGKSYRRRKKLLRDRQNRRDNGVPKGGDKPECNLPEVKIEYKEACHVQTDDFLICPVPKCGNVDLSKERSWLLGQLLSDGHRSKREHGCSVGFTINTHDAHKKYLVQTLESEFSGKVRVAKHGDGDGTRISQSGKEEWRFFSDYITGTLNQKKLLAKAFDLDQQSRLHLLGGFFDGDGSFTKEGHKLTANIYSQNMADQLFWILLSCGVKASLLKYRLSENHYPTSSEFVYTINIPSSDVPILQSYMKSDKIPQNFAPKKSRALRFFYEENNVKYLIAPIGQIDRFVYTGIGYDVEVNPEKALLASGYAVSNCRFWYENEPKVAAAIDFYCFAPETQILMASGVQKSISSIEPGDLVRSHDGTANQVIRTFARKTDEQMLSISIAGISLGQSLKVTKGHELLTKKNGEIKFVQAQFLKEGDCLLTPVEYSDSISDKIVDPDFAWLLGLYAAEGCGMPYEHTSQEGHYSSYYKGVYLTFNFTEDELVEKTVSVIHRLYGSNKVTVLKVEEDGIQRVAVYGKGIADDLIGLCPGMAKDGTKRFAPMVMKFGDEDLIHLLAGFLDGDGCFNKNNGFQGVGVSKSLSEQIANICDKLGMEYSFTSTRMSKDNRQTCYNVRISRRACSRLEGLTYKIHDNCVDESKVRNTPYCKEGKYIFRKIRSIKVQKYVGTVYDLEIENSHSYVANRISCHNSRFPMNGFSLECPDTKILAFFKHHIVDKLKLNERFKEISSEYYTLGDVFIHTDIDCDICNGIGVDPDTKETCNHPGGMFKRIFVMNPDWIEVQKSPLTDDPLIVMIPDEELQQIVHKRSPKPIYDRIPEHLKPLIMAKAPIPLSNRTISHLKHMNVPYGTYGTSIIRRLFTTLAYKTKIMTANWIVAERLILPVRVVKIGSDDRPASTTDIADVQTQLAQVANDPNLTIVTHHNFEYEWYGTSGKVLQITQEMEHIDKELLDGLMLNQALLNGEMCHDEETEVLTDSGFKNYKNVYTNDRIACYDVYTNKVIYELPLDKHEYDHDGEMIHFSGKRLDIKVTPNHKMLVSWDKSSWKTTTADSVKNGMRFIGASEFENITNVQYPIIHNDDEYSVDLVEKIIPLNVFSRFAGYYISEGSSYAKKSNYHLHVYQSQKKAKIHKSIKSNFDDMGFNYGIYNYRGDGHDQFTISNKDFVLFMREHFGHGSYFKCIPTWLKNTPKEYLETLLFALIEGDGSVRTTNLESYSYSSVSKQLIDDVQEIALKCGFSAKSWEQDKHDKSSFGKSVRYWVHFSRGENSNGFFPAVKKQHINKVPYKGKVWCFTTSTGFFVTRRNGKITIQGNSGYQSAQVGVETLIRRIESWRSSLAEWCEDRIFKPIAEMQGFVDEEESEKVGEQVFLHPTIKWNDLELKDKTQYHQMLMQLHDKQVISTQTLLDEIGLNYDQEVKRMRYEQAQMGPMGAQMGQGGGDMGGGAMGGMPGGAASPEQGGMGMGGDMGGMGMGGDMGGGMGGDMGGGGGMGGGMASGGGGKITKKGKGNKQEDEVAIPMMPIKLTKIEQKMAGMLESVANNIGFNVGEIRMQFPVENPTGGKSYSMDFAIPSLKINIESDGEVWHSSQEQVGSDQKRDYMLAQRGWTVLRFDDKAIEESTQQVEATINSYITQAMQSRNGGAKKASVEQNGHPHYYVSHHDGLKDFKGDGSKYYKYLDFTYPSRTTVHRSEVVGDRSKGEYFLTAREV